MKTAQLQTQPESSSLNRREFIQTLGTGILVTAFVAASHDSEAAVGGRGRELAIGARIHLGKDGAITVLTGKVDGGNGARTELTQAAAEELRLPATAVRLVMADTNLVPDDGTTAGSRTTPGTVPPVRRAAAALRQMLLDFAARDSKAPGDEFEFVEGRLKHKSSQKAYTYRDLANSPDIEAALAKSVPSDAALTAVKEWKVLGHPIPRPNRVDFVTGAHRFPSDIVRPGMLYGKVLRAPAYGAKLSGLDADSVKDGVLVHEGQFVGVAARTSFQAAQILDKIAKGAKWELSPHPSDKTVFDYLRQNTERPIPANPFSEERAAAKTALKQVYHVPYVQHAPLEPRAAVAEWNNGKLTVWTGSQNPFGCRAELARALDMSPEDVQVLVPDFGAGFGGKHMPDAPIEAARLAKAAGKPVCVRWTRKEEFTWAYFRPAALIEIEATLDAGNALTSWFYININSGGAALDTPYRCGRTRCEYVPARTPLRQGSYRALAAPVNNFARECFMDELASAARRDPLEFRLNHLENARLRAVLETAAKRFRWSECAHNSVKGRGYGLACGTEKGSYVAACAEIELLPPDNTVVVRRVSEVFECGPVLNPANLMAQVQGQIVMGLGPLLREQMLFENGEIRNPSFREYKVPRFSDVPKLDIHFLERPDLEPAGGGETPLIAIAPAVTNAVFQATGLRLRQLPLRISGAA